MSANSSNGRSAKRLSIPAAKARPKLKLPANTNESMEQLGNGLAEDAQEEGNVIVRGQRTMDSSVLPPVGVLHAGLVVDGRYRLLKPLVARKDTDHSLWAYEVWKAGVVGTELADGTYTRCVVIKLLRQITDTKLARFALEYALQTHLHAQLNVAGIAAAGRFHQHPYFVMEFFSGTLFDALYGKASPDRLAFAERLNVFKRVCRLVGTLHAENCVHLDLKPENILLFFERAQISVAVADFGSAQISDAFWKQLAPLVERQLCAWAPPGSPLATGNVQKFLPGLGYTFSFVAPEVLRQPRKVTERADVYALGAILYELIAGQRALPAEKQADVEFYHNGGTLAPPSQNAIAGAPMAEIARLDAIVATAMHIDAAHRYSTATDLLAAIEAWDADRKLRLHRQANRRGIAVAVLVVLLGIGAAVGAWLSDQAQREIRAQKDTLKQVVKTHIEPARLQSHVEFFTALKKFPSGTPLETAIGWMSHADLNRWLDLYEARARAGELIREPEFRIDHADYELLGLLRGYVQADWDGARQEFDRAIREFPTHANAYELRGLAWHHLGDHERAIADYRQALKLDGTATHAMTKLAYALDDAGRPKEALACVSEAIDRMAKTDAESAWLFDCRANLWLAQAQLNRALDDWNHAVKLAPQQFEFLYNRAYVRQQMGDVQGAIDDLTLAVDCSPLPAKAFNNRGNARLKLSPLISEIRDAAKQDYESAISADAANPKSFNNLGAWHFAAEEWDKAIAEFDRALALDPNYIEALTNRGAARYKVVEEGGDIDLLAKSEADLMRALELVRQPYFAVNRIDNRERQPLALLAQFYLGLVRIKQNRMTEAIAEFSAAIDADFPNLRPECNPYHGRAIAYIAQQQFALALADLNAAITQSQTSVIDHIHRGHVYAELNNPRAALADYHRAVALDGAKQFAEGWMALGRMQAEAGDLDTAKKNLDTAIAIEPTHAAARFARGALSLNRRDPAAAAPDFVACLQSDPDHLLTRPQTWAVISQRFFQVKDFATALVTVEQAVRGNAREPNYLLLRGAIKAERGDRSGAIADLDAAWPMPLPDHQREAVRQLYRDLGTTPPNANDGRR